MRNAKMETSRKYSSGSLFNYNEENVNNNFFSSIRIFDGVDVIRNDIDLRGLESVNNAHAVNEVKIYGNALNPANFTARLPET